MSVTNILQDHELMRYMHLFLTGAYNRNGLGYFNIRRCKAKSFVVAHNGNLSAEQSQIFRKMAGHRPFLLPKKADGSKWLTPTGALINIFEKLPMDGIYIPYEAITIGESDNHTEGFRMPLEHVLEDLLDFMQIGQPAMTRAVFEDYWNENGNEFMMKPIEDIPEVFHGLFLAWRDNYQNRVRFDEREKARIDQARDGMETWASWA